MTASSLEEPLLGGRLTHGVVRIGDTVRRPASANSAFIKSLLCHCEKVGFTGVPRCFGLDEHGRDIFSYIPGWVPAKFQYFTDVQVHDAGKLLRAFHDVTQNSALVSGGQVICHHDAGPNNVVFQNSRPVAFIDFDMASAGNAIDDLSYMAWTWCISSNPHRGPATIQARQVRILTDAYGLLAAERDFVVDAMLERQSENVQFWSNLPQTLTALTLGKSQMVDRINWSKCEMAFTESHRRIFNEALS